MSQNPWAPDRAAICRQCRIVLPRGGSCGDPAHQTLALDSESDRAVLAMDVFGEVHPLPRSYLPRLQVAAGWLLIAGMLGGAAACIALGSPGWGMFLIVGAVGGWVPVYFGLPITPTYSVSLERGWVGGEPCPEGDGPEMVGVVRAETPVPHPTTGQACAGWCVEMHRYSAKPTSLSASDGWTPGFAIETNDGVIVEIPAGPLRVYRTPMYLEYDLARRRDPPVSTDARGRVVVGDYWPAPIATKIRPVLDLAVSLDPLSQGRPPLFRCDEVRMLTIRPGDRLRLRSGHADAGDPGGYRDAPRRRVATGVPILEADLRQPDQGL